MRKGSFATLDPETRREISRRGGKAAHAAGSAHEYSSEEARAAGRKGGLASAAARKRRAAEVGKSQP